MFHHLVSVPECEIERLKLILFQRFRLFPEIVIVGPLCGAHEDLFAGFLIFLYYGTMKVTYQVRTTANDLKTKAKVAVAAQEYTGKAVTPVPASVTCGKGTTLKLGDDYEIVGYFNNVKKGTATIVIAGKGDYSGSKSQTFKIGAKTLSVFHE